MLPSKFPAYLARKLHYLFSFLLSKQFSIRYIYYEILFNHNTELGKVYVQGKKEKNRF